MYVLFFQKNRIYLDNNRSDLNIISLIMLVHYRNLVVWQWKCMFLPSKRNLLNFTGSSVNNKTYSIIWKSESNHTLLFKINVIFFLSFTNIMCMLNFFVKKKTNQCFIKYSLVKICLWIFYLHWHLFSLRSTEQSFLLSFFVMTRGIWRRKFL